MNTAHKFEHPVVDTLFNEYKAQGVVSNLILKSVEEMLILRNHWAQLMQNEEDKNQLASYEAEMAKIDALLMQKTEISSSVYGVSELTAIANVDAKGLNTNVKPIKGKEGKTVSMLPDLGNKPDQKLVADTVKSLLAEGKDEIAMHIVQKYYATGNYTPKRAGEPEKWNEKKINGWFNDIKKNVQRTSPKKDDKKTVEDSVPKELLDTFSNMCNTIDEERTALDDFSVMYADLKAKGSEDAAAADELVKAFFKNRHYHENNIKKWLAYVVDDSKTDIDHWKYLGVPGREEGVYTGAPSYKELEDAVIEKIQNGMDKEAIILAFVKKIEGRVVLDDKNNNYTIYTILHARDLIGNMFDENIGIHDPKDKRSSKERALAKLSTSEKEKQKKEGKLPGEGTAQKETTDKQSTKENVKTDISEKSDSVDTVGKDDKSSTAQNASTQPLQLDKLKKELLRVIRNGGIIEDALLIPEVEALTETGLSVTGGTREFDNEEKVKETVSEIFEEVEKTYEANRVYYPIGEMMRLMRISEENEIPVDEFVKNNIDLIKKKDGTFLKWAGKNVPEPIKSEDEFKTFVEEKYAYFVKQKEEKAKADKKLLEERAANQEKAKTDAEKAKLQKKVDDRLNEVDNKDDKKSKEEPKPKKFKLKNHMYKVESMNEIQALGNKIINAGGTMEHLKIWARSEIMNKQLKEMKEDAIIKDVKAMDTFIEGYFKSSFKEDNVPLGTLTKEEMINEIVELWGQEDANLSNITAKMKEYLKENNTELSIGDLVGLIKNNKPEVVVAEEVKKFSETHEELYQVVKKFTSLDEIYNQAKEMQKSGDWKGALSMALELIVDDNQIEDAKDWTLEQVTAWFNQMFNPEIDKKSRKDKTVEDVEPVVEDKSDDKSSKENVDKTTGEWDFSPLLTAKDKVEWKKNMFEFISTNEMTPECIEALKTAMTKDATGAHAKNVARSGLKQLDNTISNFIEKVKEAAKTK